MKIAQRDFYHLQTQAQAHARFICSFELLDTKKVLHDIQSFIITDLIPSFQNKSEKMNTIAGKIEIIIA
jgi:hypothetical protein